MIASVVFRLFEQAFRARIRARTCIVIGVIEVSRVCRNGRNLGGGIGLRLKENKKQSRADKASSLGTGLPRRRQLRTGKAGTESQGRTVARIAIRKNKSEKVLHREMACASLERHFGHHGSLSRGFRLQLDRKSFPAARRARPERSLNSRPSAVILCFSRIAESRVTTNGGQFTRIWQCQQFFTPDRDSEWFSFGLFSVLCSLPDAKPAEDVI